MSVYLVLYHCDNQKKSRFDELELEEECSMYNREISNAVIDGGSAILDGKEITFNGASALSNNFSRYFMIEAQNLDEAIELSQNAPLLRRGGRAEVLEISASGY